MPLTSLILLGTLPSLIWLLFFLRKDSHPESKQTVIKVFLLGMLAALPAILLEAGFLTFSDKINLPFLLSSLIDIFIGIALIEEILKYQAARFKTLEKKEFDEPVDAMIYLIIASLGFAASENILILLTVNPSFSVEEVLAVSLLRFGGATLLHALCSATVGYAVALSFYQIKKRKRLIFLGLATATLLHGLYNFSIMEIEGFLSFTIPIAILTTLAIFSTIAFEKLKKMKSVCKIK